MSKVPDQAVEETAPEELSTADLANANGGVKVPLPIYTTPGGPMTPIDSI